MQIRNLPRYEEQHTNDDSTVNPYLAFAARYEWMECYAKKHEKNQTGGGLPPVSFQKNEYAGVFTC